MPRARPLLVATGRRLVWSAVTLVGVIAITFMIANLVPADPAALLAGQTATAEQVEALRAKQGLDQPLPIQLWRYLMRLITGDLGTSLFTARPVSGDLVARLPATIELASVALLISVAIGIPVGVVAALHRNGAVDHLVRIVTVSGFAIANFWLAIILQLLF